MLAQSPAAEVWGPPGETFALCYNKVRTSAPKASSPQLEVKFSSQRVFIIQRASISECINFAYLCFWLGHAKHFTHYRLCPSSSFPLGSQQDFTADSTWADKKNTAAHA